jgi:hypothetical protein
MVQVLESGAICHCLEQFSVANKKNTSFVSKETQCRQNFVESQRFKLVPVLRFLHSLVQPNVGDYQL